MPKPGQDIEPIDGTLPFSPPGLEGRTADEPTIVRWVARNIDVPEPDPKTCPDPFAWTLLRTCRGNSMFVAFFVEKLWAKLIPPRSQLEAAGPKVQDGRSVIELTERILAHAQEAEGESLAASVASRPRKPVSPEPVVSAFESFDPEEELPKLKTTKKEEECPSSETTPSPEPVPPAARQLARATAIARRARLAASGVTSPAPPEETEE